MSFPIRALSNVRYGMHSGAFKMRGVCGGGRSDPRLGFAIAVGFIPPPHTGLGRGRLMGQ